MNLPELEIPKELLEKLETGLKGAHQEMRENPREGAITALQSVINFVNSIARLEAQSLALPLVHIMASLQDLKFGRVSPIVTPICGFDNRKPETGMRKAERGIIIFFMNELIKARMSVEDSAKFMAPILKKCGINIDGHVDTPEWRTLVEWRNYTKKRPENDQEVSVIQGFESACAFPPGTPLETIKATISQQLPLVLEHWNRGLRAPGPASRPE